MRANESSDEHTALETLTDQVLDRSLGSGWKRLAPLSVGAVACSALVVAAGGLARRLVGERGRQFLGAVGAVALVPLALWLLTEPPEPRPTDAGSAPEDSQGVQGKGERQTGES